LAWKMEGGERAVGVLGKWEMMRRGGWLEETLKKTKNPKKKNVPSPLAIAGGTMGLEKRNRREGMRGRGRSTDVPHSYRHRRG
jgi:hypothetical protein